MKKKIHVTTLGCDKNTVDAELMLSVLSEQAEIVADPEAADVIMVNTCCFIQSAKEESIDYILSYANLKNEGSCEKLIVSGCMAERYQQELQEEIPEIDAFLGVGHLKEVGKVLDALYNGDKRTQVVTGDIDAPYPEEIVRYIPEKTSTVYLKISEGCDHHCTYCVIPKIRGKHRSRMPEAILKEAADLSERGTRELILIAQDITQYGSDLEEDWDLPKLLTRLAEDYHFPWIRLLYLYPEGITSELLEVIASHDNIVNYFDMPLQHTEDRILRQMARRITHQEIFDVVDAIRKRLPDAVIRTSLIAGFPGESEADHEAMCESLEALELDRVGVFGYSQEEGTPAATFPDQLSDDEIEFRKQRIYTLQEKIIAKRNVRFKNTIQTVLIETNEGDNTWSGRLYADAPEVDCIVLVSGRGKELVPGNFYKVKLIQILDYEMIGDVIEDEFTE